MCVPLGDYLQGEGNAGGHDAGIEDGNKGGKDFINDNRFCD